MGFPEFLTQLMNSNPELPEFHVTPVLRELKMLSDQAPASAEDTEVAVFPEVQYNQVEMPGEGFTMSMSETFVPSEFEH